MTKLERDYNDLWIIVRQARKNYTDNPSIPNAKILKLAEEEFKKVCEKAIDKLLAQNTSAMYNCEGARTVDLADAYLFYCASEQDCVYFKNIIEGCNAETNGLFSNGAGWYLWSDDFQSYIHICTSLIKAIKGELNDPE